MTQAKFTATLCLTATRKEVRHTNDRETAEKWLERAAKLFVDGLLYEHFDDKDDKIILRSRNGRLVK